MARYLNSGDVTLRLNMTYGMYKGRYVIFNNEKYQGGNDTTIDVYDVAEKKTIAVVDANDSEVDATPFNMGFFATDEFASYASRAPTRKQQQGANANNTFQMPLVNVVGNAYQQFRGSGLSSPGFIKMVYDKFDPLEKCLQFARMRNYISYPINKKFALYRDPDVGLLKLYYIITQIGWWAKDQEFFIPEKFKHYIPMLQAKNLPFKVIENAG